MYICLKCTQFLKINAGNSLSVRLVHGNSFLLMHIKYSRYTPHFIGLVHINDLVVFNTWWSLPMHICMLQVSRSWWYVKFACYSCFIEITLIGSVWISFLHISVEFNFSRNLRLIHSTETCIGTRIFNWKVGLEPTYAGSADWSLIYIINF